MTFGGDDAPRRAHLPYCVGMRERWRRYEEVRKHFHLQHWWGDGKEWEGTITIGNCAIAIDPLLHANGSWPRASNFSDGGGSAMSLFASSPCGGLPRHPRSRRPPLHFLCTIAMPAAPDLPLTIHLSLPHLPFSAHREKNRCSSPYRYLLLHPPTILLCQPHTKLHR